MIILLVTAHIPWQQILYDIKNYIFNNNHYSNNFCNLVACNPDKQTWKN